MVSCGSHSPFPERGEQFGGLPGRLRQWEDFCGVFVTAVFVGSLNECNNLHPETPSPSSARSENASEDRSRAG